MSREEQNKKRGIKFWLSVSMSFSLFLATVLLVIWFIMLRDPRRNTFVRSELTSAEIIQKNYVNGFENTKNSEKFIYILPQDDINNLLSDGVKTINNKHIESIYFEYGENGVHTVYVDLTKTFIKTRVVVTTYVSDYGNDYIDLKILTCKIGKVESTKYLTRKGYLTSEWLNKYFEACHLPITYSQINLTLKVEVSKYIKEFPTTKIGTNFLNLALQDKTNITVNPALFGFTIDLSKVRSRNDIEINNWTAAIPNFYNELDTACKGVDFASMSVGEKRTAYSITEATFANLLKDSISTAVKEEVIFKDKKTTFNLVDAQPTFKEDKIDVSLIYSINDLLVDSTVEVELTDMSNLYFDVTLEVKYENQYSASFLEGILENLQEIQPNFFEFNENQGCLFIELDEMNAALPEGSLKNSYKYVEINPLNKTLDFIVEKTL